MRIPPIPTLSQEILLQIHSDDLKTVEVVLPRDKLPPTDSSRLISYLLDKVYNCIQRGPHYWRGPSSGEVLVLEMILVRGFTVSDYQ